MTYISDLLGTLVFRADALRDQSERRAYVKGLVVFASGFLAYALIRNSVYAALPEVMSQQSGIVGSIVNLKLGQTLLFLFLIYIPALVLLCGAISGEAQGMSISRPRYQSHLSALLPLWGVLFLVTAPLQWVIPHFLIIGMFELSVGWCVRSILIIVYTPWAIKHVNCLATAQAIAVAILSCFTLPLLLLL
jgi:hypothetical protein